MTTFKAGDRVAAIVHWSGYVSGSGSKELNAESFMASEQATKRIVGVVNAVKNGVVQIWDGTRAYLATERQCKARVVGESAWEVRVPSRFDRWRVSNVK